MADAALWARVGAVVLGALPEALQRDTGHSAGKVARVVEEYRRFLYLVAVGGQSAGGQVLAPSRLVDKAWHLHLADPGYAAFCVALFGRVIRHHEGRSLPFADPAYAATLRAYQREFGTPAFWRVWPRPEDERRRAGAVAATLGLGALGIYAGFQGHSVVCSALIGGAAVALVLSIVLTPWPVAASRGGGCGGSSDDDGGGCGGD
jgi:hypothetical protein